MLRKAIHSKMSLTGGGHGRQQRS